jgi:tripeptidyl-peptidase-1
LRRHAPDAILPLRFGLTQPNVDMNTLEELLNEVSHPESPQYGKHWTPARVAPHFAPSDEAVHVVTSWITGNGFAKERIRVGKTKGWVMLNATVAETEMLLSTEYHVYADESSGMEHIGVSSFPFLFPAHGRHRQPATRIVFPPISSRTSPLSRPPSTSTSYPESAPPRPSRGQDTPSRESRRTKLPRHKLKFHTETIWNTATR